MSETKELTYSDVSEHKSKKDLYMVIHDKVYNASTFVDEHPGGEEVMLDVGGQDATEAFEDVGHSDEAREILEGLLVGNLKRQDGDPAPKKSSSGGSSGGGSTGDGGSGGASLGVYLIILVGGGLAYLAYQYLQQQENNKKWFK